MRARKVDATHKALLACFEKLGCLVHSTNGEWDATVTKFGIVRLIEFKDPKSPNLKRRNKGDDLRDKGWPIHRCMTMVDVINVVNGIKRD